MSFKDHFSGVSQGYATFRPSYPPELFEWLATLPPRREVALDCACGSGQATVELGKKFARVIATDASAAQISSAPRDCPNIDWRVAPAEESGVPAESLDLVTVAQALHWFDLPRFYTEVRRVLRRDGVIAVWCYGVNKLGEPSVDSIMQDFYTNVVGPYWPPERRIVEAGYRTLDFPFRELTVPPFAMETHWDLPRLLGYCGTWSATTRYMAATGINPLIEFEQRLRTVWSDPTHAVRVIWPLSIRAGRLE